VSHSRGMWHAIFHLQTSVGEKILRTILVYAVLVVLLRIVGKRELGQANTLDLIVLLLVANAVQNGVIGNDLSVTGAVIGAVTLFAVNEGLNRASYFSPLVSRVLEGRPAPLIKDGKLQRRTLRGSGISLAELQALARRQGFDDLDKVREAILETNGSVSMFPHE
jgi:uncharacterized membrane protein YcaP (DUF421 family)